MSDIDPGGEKAHALRHDVDRLIRDSGMVNIIDPEQYQQLLDNIVDMVFAQARGEE